MQERHDAYTLHVRQHPDSYDPEIRTQLASELNISYNSQQNALPAIKAIREEYKEIAAHVLQDALRRLDKAFHAFYKRVQKGQEPGYPRCKSRSRYDSFTYPDGAGWKLATRQRPEGKKGMVKVTLKLSKIGSVTLHLHRDIAGTIKTCTLKREVNHWSVIFSCEVADPEPLPLSYEDIGIDLGIVHLATLSTGEIIEHPRCLGQGEHKRKADQQALARKKRRSHRREKAKRAVGKAYRKIRNQRRLVNRYQGLVFEDIQIKNLTKKPEAKQDEQGNYLPNGAAAKGGLNTSILDAVWGIFVDMCSAKAEEAGRTLLKVSLRFTSQICSSCGTVRKRTCPSADTVASVAQNLTAMSTPLSTYWHTALFGRDAAKVGNRGEASAFTWGTPQARKHRKRCLARISYES